MEPDPPVDPTTWYWEDMVFRTVRSGVEVRCEVFPGAGRVLLRVQDGERLMVEVDVQRVESIGLEHRGEREVMIVRAPGQASSLVVGLRPTLNVALRPLLHVAWAVDDGD